MTHGLLGLGVANIKHVYSTGMRVAGEAHS